MPPPARVLLISSRKHAAIAGESLNDLRLVIESHGESLIFAAAQDAVEKIDGGFLLELDAVADAVGSVQKHADAQWQIGLLAEKTDFLGQYCRRKS